jgi:hypothetical protein
MLTFRPNVDIAFGDDLTLISANVEFVGWVALNSVWSAYLGGGPAAVFEKFSGGDLELGGAFNILAGFQHQSGLFAEIRNGASGNGPSLAVRVGYVLGL